MSDGDGFIEIDKMSIDQFAGGVVLILGSVSSLLLVLWQSKCLCKINFCYVFQCERRAPNETEIETLKKQYDKSKKDNKKDKEKDKEDEEENIIP